ncbi:hypothetical protein F511_12276 [Dorcoceras hygrometricum]|uniref:Uncharacterized protein n=1 Tax=Dorcoceras hygrometricum TaxID=472368 RepID=A0A2Z7D9Q0_9LAMI|nr:hypothetical protein F511_12276 [Dorcoceras hygrometricum]
MEEKKVAQPRLSQESRHAIVCNELHLVGHLNATVVGVVALVGAMVGLRGTGWTRGWYSRWGSGHGRPEQGDRRERLAWYRGRRRACVG